MIVLKDFEVKNFRSCALTRTQFDTQLTALVGINGSGKTNFLNAILLLKGILQPKFNAFFMRHNDLPEDHSSLTAKFDIDGKNIGLKADIWFDAREGRDSIVYSDTKMRNLDIKYSRWEQTLITPALRPFHTPSRSDGLLWNFKAPPKDSSATRYSREIKEFLSQIQYYSATQFSDPTRSPLSFEIDDTRPIETLKRSGVHERFLYDVYSQYQENKSDYKRYVDIVGQKGLGLIDEFVFGSYNMTNGSIRVQSGGMVQKVEKVREWVVPSIVIDGLQLSANQLSEGTFKTLALVFYILRSETSVLLVEEPEVCIHHGLLDSRDMKESCV